MILIWIAEKSTFIISVGICHHRKYLLVKPQLGEKQPLKNGLKIIKQGKCSKGEFKIMGVKLYTESQFTKYANLLQKMANENRIAENFMIHLEIDDWIEKERLLQEGINQMDKRIEAEASGELAVLRRLK